MYHSNKHKKTTTSDRSPVHKMHTPKSKVRVGKPGTEKKHMKKTFSLREGKFY